MSVHSYYLSEQHYHLKEDIKRLARAKRTTPNNMLGIIIKDWFQNNKRYVDKKITDFEVQEVEKIIEQTPVYCKECFSKETDDGDFVIHDYGCSYTLSYSNKDDKEVK